MEMLGKLIDALGRPIEGKITNMYGQTSTMLYGIKQGNVCKNQVKFRLWLFFDIPANEMD